jgi:hypothetical protein
VAILRYLLGIAVMQQTGRLLLRESLCRRALLHPRTAPRPPYIPARLGSLPSGSFIGKLVIPRVIGLMHWDPLPCLGPSLSWLRDDDSERRSCRLTAKQRHERALYHHRCGNYLHRVKNDSSSCSDTGCRRMKLSYREVVQTSR